MDHQSFPRTFWRHVYQDPQTYQPGSKQACVCRERREARFTSKFLSVELTSHSREPPYSPFAVDYSKPYEVAVHGRSS